MQQLYVQLMMDIIGRGLVASSKVDPEIQKECKQFPVGFCFAMDIFSNKTAFYAKVNSSHQIELLKTAPKKIDLTITFKHLRHAFLVFSFQESTAQAFAQDRMIANGNISLAIRLVRCLNRLEVLILPKFLAIRAVKQYPNQLTLQQKFKIARQIYFKLALSYLKGNR